MGAIEDYDRFLAELQKVCRHCFDALAPGGRLICVVGDVCLSRRKNTGTRPQAVIEVAAHKPAADQVTVLK